MAKRLTLAEQLAQISEPAPQDFDPEDSYATYGNERNPDETDLAAGRSEYVEVGTSKLRKKGEAVYDAKYEGKKGSRKELYGADEDEEESEDDEDLESDEEMDDFEDLAGGESAFPPSEEGEDDDDEEAESMPPPPAKSAKPKKVSSRKAGTTTKEQDERAMMTQLKSAASADIDKGRDVKKQLAFCDNILEARIKLQKAATAVNSIPQASNADIYFSLLPTELQSTLAEVEALNEELFLLRQDLLGTNEQIELPSGFGASRKRKIGTEGAAGGADYLKASLTDLATLELAMEPFMRATVTKWSDKVLSASGLALSSSKKFKAVNQNVIHAIDHALAPGERERLVKRTRVRRAVVGVVGKNEGDTLEGEKEIDPECFDDGDFYQQMLRDVVESRMLDLDDSTLASLRLASARGKKQKKVVDTRASKGRKIRYHIHEKVQNFMIPIEAAGWHDEQTDELFASLLGRSFPMAQEDDETADATDIRINSGEVGALRIFG